MSGYIKLYRGWRDTDGLAASECFSECEAWLWLLEHAAWKTLTRWNAKGEEITLEAGQIHVSLRSLSTAWGWKKDKVSRFLARLERVKKARQLTGQSGTVLVIENWAKYQGSETVTATADATAVRQPCDTHKEGKEGKEKKNDKAYAFCGSVIQLTQTDFDQWQQSFTSLDLMAELQSRDDYLSTQGASAKKNWFISTSNRLKTLNAAARQQEREGNKPYVPIC